MQKQITTEKTLQVDISTQVQLKLKEIEKTQNVEVLYAVESGSRAWGFASPDSDYDVRFIYVRPAKQYLELQPKKDFIDWELNEVFDINGWDLSRTLQYLHKSNATFFEWANSPIVYYESPKWSEISKLQELYFSCKSVMYHYYGTAQKNYLEHLGEEWVSYKKYFYVLRPLLACKWIEQKASAPPVRFDLLMEEVLEENLKPIVVDLIHTKMQMAEHEKGRRIEVLHAYIEQKLAYYREKAAKLTDDRNADWKVLNQAFLGCLGNL